MSRSRRKTPIFGATTAHSEKRDKITNHKRIRLAIKQAIKDGEEILPDEKELSDPWTMAKDGKRWYKITKTNMRK